MAASAKRTSKSSRAAKSAKSSKASRKPRGSSASGRTRAADETGTVDRVADAAAREALLASDKLYYRIGEVSELTGVKAHVLRYWETEFRWMAPPKSRSKQRLYRKRDIEFVWLLKRLLWEERYTIAGARQRIQDMGVDQALALLDEPATPVAAEDAAASRAEWVALRGALDQMKGELLDLRGLLQEGA